MYKNDKKSCECALYDTAVKDFLYVSEQRLKFIRFYIILIGFFLSAVGFVFFKNPKVDNNILALGISFIIEASLMILTYVFHKIDNRHYDLIDILKQALISYEMEYLHKINRKSHKLCILSNDKEKESTISKKLKYLFYLGYALGTIFFLMSFALTITHLICPFETLIF